MRWRYCGSSNISFLPHPAGSKIGIADFQDLLTQSPLLPTAQLRRRVFQKIHHPQPILSIPRIELHYVLNFLVRMHVDVKRLGANDPRHRLAAWWRCQRACVLDNIVRRQE
jgi:hypothetical protein